MFTPPQLPPHSDVSEIARRILWVGAIVTFVGWVGFATWFARLFFREKHRTRHGLCLHCGYDIRANVGKCPECGADIETE